MQTGPAATAISNTHSAARMLLPLQLFRKELVNRSNYTLDNFFGFNKKKENPRTQGSLEEGGENTCTLERMGTMTSGGGALRTGAALALAAGAGALGVYAYRAAVSGRAGYLIGASPASGSASKPGSHRARREPAAEPTGPVVNVFFGSQTGTAEEFAKMLAKEARAQKINAAAVDLERFEPGMLPNSFSIFLVATYGEGDPTDNARSFHDWLVTTADSTSLAGCNFAVFGLGNTQYEHYNSEAKFVDNMCQQYGGNRMLVLGLGDDDKDIRGDFDEWMNQLWPALREHLGMEQSGQDWLEKGVEYKCDFRVYASEAEAKRIGSLRTSNSIDAAGKIPLRVVANREICTGGDRSCRHVELDILDEASSYETGDHVAIFAENDAGAVEALAQRLQADLDTWICLTDSDGMAPFPCPCTLRDALTKHLDINAAPRRALLVALAEMAEAPADKERLVSLASRDKTDHYHDFIIRGMRTLLDVLAVVPSVNPPLGKLLELLPRLQPRYYSISSASVTSPRCVHVTAVVVETVCNDGRTFKGVCTWYLKHLKVGQTVWGYLRRTTFKLPPNPQTPVIMVGAGTGLAPLRGMCWHIQARRAQLANGETHGTHVLIFGCRRRDHDFLYGDEIQQWVRDKTLAKVHLAFSRDPDNMGAKVYVQNKVDDNAMHILSLLDDGGHFYVCGSTVMARDVKKALMQALVFMRNMTGGKAEAYLERLTKEGRYLQDVWST